MKAHAGYYAVFKVSRTPSVNQIEIFEAFYSLSLKINFSDGKKSTLEAKTSSRHSCKGNLQWATLCYRRVTRKKAGNRHVVVNSCQRLVFHTIQRQSCLGTLKHSTIYMRVEMFYTDEDISSSFKSLCILYLTHVSYFS